ncbi:hypothetical protein LOZ53_003921 [Ophidiomyces ophidiicola]|nr:hypothetical protein LOZ55_004689 [Ophidiomyces ophidiicola]KAI1986090.1 hypothetical protein LOZ54_003994 [Ophidiomyces ophidiicola]KAI1988468.1 hypothetical protein LOZ53_003921 [Ophidiomyces ophidiicola]KAI1988881.1 hypothetical protein LOZ51_005268 [Ophidiomyces ophidiicola]
MAATGELPLAIHVPSPAPNFNSCYDTSDMDAYINFEPVYPSPSLSPPTETKPVNPQPLSHPYQHSSNLSQSPASTNASFASNTQFPQQASFNAPSHQYASYQQQTGLPMGALANTVALNPALNMNMGFPDPSLRPADGFGLVSRPGDYLSANQHPVMSFPSDPVDMDMESDPTGLSHTDMLSSQPSKAQFVDPITLGSQEPAPVASTSQVGRVYPGIHQQAARARAAQQQRQQELIRRQQQQHQIAQNQAPNHSRLPSRSYQPKVNRPVDPVVEERISRLLQQMRQSSVAAREDQPTVSNSLPQPPRQKKDEQDMDEDERLLASEEGKKLSSKERRQLRNKVSARAFRSRRKEYIGQLEGELTAKTNEATDLRLQNRALMEENARLTDLTRMLLSSPQFASFLNDVSRNGLPSLLQKQPSSQPNQSSTDPLNDAKSVHHSQDGQTQNPQTTLPTVTEDQFDFTSLESGWNSGIDVNYANPTVLAVLEVPECPSVDATVLSGKGSIVATSFSKEEMKDLAPHFSHLEIDNHNSGSQEEHASCAVHVDDNNPSFALYRDQPNSESGSETLEGLSREPEQEKRSAHFDLVVDSDILELGLSDLHNKRRFERFRSNLEGAFQRLYRATLHLE